MYVCVYFMLSSFAYRSPRIQRVHKHYTTWAIARIYDLYLPSRLSCRMFLEFVKNGRNDGLGVEPTDRLSMSGPESSASPHDSDSSSWNNASRSRSPRSPLDVRFTLPSSSSGILKRFNNDRIFCLKFRCCNCKCFRDLIVEIETHIMLGR